MAPATALAAIVCFLLVAPAPARQHVDFPPQLLPDAVDREAAAEPLLPKPVAGADAADMATALAVPEEGEEGPARRGGRLPSLLCLVFRCDGDADAVAVRSGDSQDGWAQPAGKADAEADDFDSEADDSDSDCESDSDDEDDDGGIVGWFWSLAHRF
ncbi:hypothetical protein ABZP36_017148 [Zizania latifolia]